LSALLDREPVDPDELSAVLEEGDSRRLLVDFIRLRQLIDRQDDEHPLSNATLSSGLAQVRWPWRAAAAAVLLSSGLAGGFWAGGFWAGERAAQERPPRPDRVVQFQEGVDWSDSAGPQVKVPR
jgi:hypothetical protein